MSMGPKWLSAQLPLLLVSVLLAAGGEIEWTHRTVLDRASKVTLSWAVQEDRIHFLYEVATLGYVGLGLSSNGAMAGADIMIAWVRDDGRVFLKDCYGTGNVVPSLDPKQSWILERGTQNDTHTVVQFSRLLDTCDEKDYPITNDTVRLIYAYHTEEPSTDTLPPLYHGLKRRGSRSIMLLQPHLPPPPTTSNSSELLYWDALAPNYTLPDERHTMYWCKILKAPYLPAKHHIYKVAPVIQPGNEGYIHHIILYHCKGRTEEEAEPYVHHPGHECHHPNMPDIFDWCEGVFAAWGIGGEVMMFPEHAGMPIGGGEERYFMLEVHYDNQAFHSGIQDQSGLRVFYTPHLRRYDAMTLMIGATFLPYVIIPPHQKEFVVSGHGDPNCLADAMPKDGIKIFAVLLHAHLLGRKIVARHFRGNVELAPIAADNNYDFNYQEYRYVNEVTVLPGDHLIVECTYDSTERETTTFGGLSTHEEMCLAFFLYYPRISSVASISNPSSNLVMGLTGITEMKHYLIRGPHALANKSYIEHLSSFPWNDKYVRIVEDALRYGPHETVCLLGDGNKLEVPSLVTYPPVNKPFEEKTECSLREDENTEPRAYTGASSCRKATPIVALLIFIFHASSLSF